MDAQLPLLTWEKQAEHFRLQASREELLIRISKLRPHAHKRLALEERVQQITLRQMEIENELHDRTRALSR